MTLSVRPKGCETVRQDMKKGLETYYQVDGIQNGSKIVGTILPPDIKDEVALKARIDDLSAFLSTKEAIKVRPTPDWGQGRIEDRAEVAAAASGWVKASGVVALKAATNLIVDPSIRAMVDQGLKECSEFLFSAASSSSGMFHPADEINKGGLALHTARVVQMGEYLGEYFGLNAQEKDQMRAGLILHDSVKGGNPWTVEKSYAADHGELAGQLIRGLDGPEEAKAVAAQIADNHMALWRQKADKKTPNPKVPDNKMDMIASLADYLAARDNVYLDVPGVDKSVSPTTTTAEILRPFSYSGTTRKPVNGFPRGIDVTTEKEELRITVDGQTFSSKVNSSEIKEGFLSYGVLESKDGGTVLEGMSAKANMWLLTGAGGGKVVLTKGDQECEYFVRPAQN